jgi:hypothetical protein
MQNIVDTVVVQRLGRLREGCSDDDIHLYSVFLRNELKNYQVLSATMNSSLFLGHMLS